MLSQTIKLSSSYEMFSPVFWSHFKHKVVLYYFLKSFSNSFNYTSTSNVPEVTKIQNLDNQSYVLERR